MTYKVGVREVHVRDIIIDSPKSLTSKELIKMVNDIDFEKFPSQYLYKLHSDSWSTSESE